MNDKKRALIVFFEAVKRLKELNIIRSDKFLGDIGEYICIEKYNMELVNSQREPGYDGTIGSKKVQVKFHNSPKRTNIALGNPEKYDEVIIILGPDSMLRPDNGSKFLIYFYDSSFVKNNLKSNRGYYCAKSHLQEPEDHYDLSH